MEALVQNSILQDMSEGVLTILMSDLRGFTARSAAPKREEGRM